MACLKERNRTAPKDSVHAKEKDSPIMSAKEMRAVESRGNRVIKLDKKPVNRAPPQMKIIYSKKIIGADDPDFIQPKGLSSKQSAMESLFKIPATRDQAENSEKQERSTSKIEKHSEMTDNKTSTGNDAVEELVDDYIEVNEMHCFSKLKNEIKPRLIKPNIHIDMLVSSGMLDSKTRQKIKNALLPQYHSQLQRLTGLSVTGRNFVTPAPMMPYMPPGIQQLGYSKHVDNSPHDSNSATKHFKYPHPQIVINNEPVLGAHQTGNSGVTQNSRAMNFKAALNSLRRRNLTSPDLQRMAESSSVTKGNNPDTPITPKCQQAPLAVHQKGVKGLIAPNIPLEDFSAGQSPMLPMRSIDSLQVPQLKHICSSVKSMKYTKSQMLNGVKDVNVINEQYSEEENESIDNSISLNSFSPANDHAAKLNELRKRNKTELPSKTKTSTSEAIFKENPENECLPKSPRTPERLSQNQIQETDEPAEDESSSSNYIGDKLFELNDDSDQGSCQR